MFWFLCPIVVREGERKRKTPLISIIWFHIPFLFKFAHYLALSNEALPLSLSLTSILKRLQRSYSLVHFVAMVAASMLDLLLSMWVLN